MASIEARLGKLETLAVQAAEESARLVEPALRTFIFGKGAPADAAVMLSKLTGGELRPLVFSPEVSPAFEAVMDEDEHSQEAVAFRAWFWAWVRQQPAGGST